MVFSATVNCFINILEFIIVICTVCILQAKLEEQTQKAEKEREGAKLERMKASAINEKLAAEKAELDEALAKGDEVVNEMSTKVKQLEAEKNHLDKQVLTNKKCHSICISNSIILMKQLSLYDIKLYHNER